MSLLHQKSKVAGPWILICLVAIFLASGCKQDTSDSSQEVLTESINTAPTSTLFSAIKPASSGIQFRNTINESSTENYFSYNYFYNGGGVAVGDVNNDGLVDIYLSGNQVSNKLYLNKGDFTFEDVTFTSGTGVSDRWSTGVSMIDINTDGWLDIYVCAAGAPADSKKRQNLLFINQHDGTFKEQSEQYGLADLGHSTQAYFWDYDRDNDLDVYVVNHRIDFKNNSKIDSEIARDIQPATSDQLYQNNNGSFVNVTASAGIANKAWGLSASVADYNDDDWPDIYVACDFLEPDLLYLNNKNGTFREASKEVFKHISFYGMGSDVGDINNDGLMDLFVLDMVSEDHIRSKRNMASMSNDNFWNMVKYGFHRQYMLNTLQLNNGNGSFSEISNMAGTAKTDWSWAPLIADFDLDGHQDIFVTNGIKRDVTDNDFRIKAQQVVNSGESLTADKALSMMTSAKISNYAFRNNGDNTFDKVQKRWGLDARLNSNGAMYADFDNDGDLDLIINNIDAPVSIYKNGVKSDDIIRIKLEGPQNNPNGVGATVKIQLDNETHVRSFYPNRGFMSSSAGPMSLAVNVDNILSAEVIWSDGRRQILTSLEQNQINTISYKAASESKNKKQTTLFSVANNNLGIDYAAVENEHDDFINEILLPHRQSRLGPTMSVGDVNGDGLEDIFFGGPLGQNRSLFIQRKNSSFKKLSMASGKNKEDVGSILFDADGDTDLDLYIVCGGNESVLNSKVYADELWLNDGQGQFTRSTSKLPAISASGKVVTAGDYDGDGDLDLFVGGGAQPEHYPLPDRSYLLQNNNGSFKDVTPKELKKPGIVSAAKFNDIDDDGDQDLIFTGEWMPVKLSMNENGKFKSPVDILPSNGWFQHIAVVDVNQDGKKDIIAGNIGLNNKFHPTPDHPLHLYFADFDDNGKSDIVLSKDKGNHKLPIRGRECSSQQMPFITEKFPTFQSFAEANLSEIYGDKLADAYHVEAHNFGHQLLLQQTDGSFKSQQLPNHMQQAPLMGFSEINVEGGTRFIYAGNFYPAEVETVRYDGGIGGLVSWNEKTFESMHPIESGLYLDGDVRHMEVIKLANNRQVVIAACNNSTPQVFILSNGN